MKNGIYYECDDCHVKTTFKSRDVARKVFNWAIDKHYNNCWCSKCAPAHRVGKAAEKNDAAPLQLPPGFEQIKIDNL